MKKFLTYLVLASGICAGALKLHKNQKGKFNLNYPADWIEIPAAGDVQFAVASPDATANVQIKTATLKGNMTACQYLIESEAASRGRENLISEEKRKPTPPQIKNLGVKDACLGAYRIMQGENEILQG